MEDDAIISLIQIMESDEEKRDIFEDLEAIKAFLEKRKRKCFK